MSRVYFTAAPDGSGFYYLLPHESYGATWVADGLPVTKVNSNLRWWFTERRADVITCVKQDGLDVLGYELKDESAVSERFPATLTPEQWAARDDESDLLWSLYSRVAEAIPGERTDYLAADFVDLGSGEPAPNDNLTWTAKLPYELQYHTELLHLFPGRLSGFREHLATRLNQIPGVKAYHQSGTFEIYFELRFAPPKTEWRGALLRSGDRSKSRGSNVERKVTRSEKVSPPHAIDGPNRAAALTSWRELMDRWVAEVADYATARLCGHCDGVGISPAKFGGAK